MPITFLNIPTFFCPVLSSLLTYFTCDSQFFLSILQCQGEWCHKLDSCPFPSGIHKWIIFYFHKNSSVLPDCLGLYESQMVLPPHTFQQPLTISIMPALWNVHLQPSLQQMYTAVTYQLLGGFLTMLDKVLIVWFYGGKSLKSESLSAFLLKWWWWPWVWLPEFWEGHSSKTRQLVPSMYLEKNGSTYLFLFILKVCRDSNFYAESLFATFCCSQPWLKGRGEWYQHFGNISDLQSLSTMIYICRNSYSRIESRLKICT